jgi:hypothetical protein
VVDAPWRAAALQAECALRGVASVVGPSDSTGFIPFRTAYSAALAPLGARWLTDAAKRPPERFVLDGRRLRLWVIAAGAPDGAQAFHLSVIAPERPVAAAPDEAAELESAQESARDLSRDAAEADAGESAEAVAQEDARQDGSEANKPDKAELRRAREAAAAAERAARAAEREARAAEREARAAAEQDAKIALELQLAPVEAALAAAGLPAVLVGSRTEGSAYRIVGRRRLARLAELIGDPPPHAPSGEWPM